MNNVALVARLAQEPILRTTTGGTDIASLRVAIPRPRRNGTDQGADFVDVVTFGRQAHACVEHLVKGQRVAITGRLAHSEWTTDNGEHRSKLEVIARTVDFLNRPTAADDDGDTEPEVIDTAA